MDIDSEDICKRLEEDNEQLSDLEDECIFLTQTMNV